MKSAVSCITRQRRIRAGLLFGLLLVAPAPMAWAQIGGGIPPSPAVQTQEAPQPQDALGRGTPRGTVLGFMSAGRDGNNELSVQYLNTRLRGQEALELANQLYVVLDSRLPARLNQLSDRPEGAPSNPLRPDENLVGTISTDNGPVDIIVERVTRGNAGPLWLFSERTLALIPDIHSEVDLVSLDRFLPEILTRPRVFGIRLLGWLVFFLLVPLSYRLLAVLDWPLKPLAAFLRRRLGEPDADLDKPVPGLVRLLVLGLVIRWAIARLEVPLFERQFWSAVSGLLLIVALAWALLIVNAFVESYFSRRFESRGELRLILRLARRCADGLWIGLCALIVVRYFGFDPTAALAGVGIGGIAVALAAQKTLENIIAGLSLIFDKAVSVGDLLKFGETTGTVDHIGLRSTRIRTLDRTIVSVPNGQIASAGIETLSARDKFWFHHVVGLRYGTTAEQMRAVVERVQALLLADASVDSDSVRVRFFRLGSISLDVEVFAYVFADDWNRFLETQQVLLIRIMDAIEKSGTEIAVPSQAIHIAGDQLSSQQRRAAPVGQ